MFSSRNWALLAAFFTAVIFGISFTVGKEVVQELPYTVIVFVRVFVTGFLFWICGFFIGVQPPIHKKHYKNILICAICGACLNQLTAYKSLETAQPIVAAAINISTPVIVLLFSSIFTRNKIPAVRIFGVFIGLAGALLLIFHKGFEGDVASFSEIKGNIYMFTSAFVYAFYLISARELLQNYHPVHIAKWLYSLSLPVVFLFALGDFGKVDWQNVSGLVYLKFFYVVFFVTFLNYLFNLIALTRLKPTTVSVFVYFQPVIASIYALFVGSDTLSFTKVFAIILTSAGVYLAGKQTKK